MATPLPVSRRPSDVWREHERNCPFCCEAIPKAAKKCRACGEWVVRTSGGVSSVLLRLFALVWAGVTLLGAAGLWTLGRGIRQWVWLHAVDPAITPQVVDLALYAVIALVTLKGLMVSVGLGLTARMAPRRPAWWS